MKARPFVIVGDVSPDCPDGSSSDDFDRMQVCGEHYATQVLDAMTDLAPVTHQSLEQLTLNSATLSAASPSPANRSLVLVDPSAPVWQESTASFSG